MSQKLPSREEIISRLEKEFFYEFDTVEGCKEIIFDEDSDGTVQYGISSIQQELREKYPDYDYECRRDNGERADRKFTDLLLIYAAELQKRLADAELQKLK